MPFAEGGSDKDAVGGRKRKQEAKSGSARTKSRDANNNKGDVKITIGSLLKYMEGYEVIVELKTGKRHRGNLASADDNMNLMLEEQQDLDLQETDGADKKCTTTVSNNVPISITRNIRGSKIRYVHFPDNANLSALVRSGRERERNASNKYQKTKRVQKN